MGRIEPCAVGISGRIKSGKTTVSQAFADALQWPRASFGDFVRSIARSRNLDDGSRSVLQSLGESLISEGWPKFCQDVLGIAGWQPGSPLVVDGIRHVEAVVHLTNIVIPLRFIHVHIAIDEQLRIERIRHEFGEARLQDELGSHSTESAVKDGLPQTADLVVDGAVSLDSIIAEIIESLERGQ